MPTATSAATWKAYHNSAWPTEYLIDRSGHIREVSEGEGRYDDTERRIRELLGESSNMLVASVPDKTPSHLRMTPESYLGWLRLDRYAGGHLDPNKFADYHFPRSMPPDSLAYAGRWKVGPERITPVFPTVELDGKPYVPRVDPQLLPPNSVELERTIHYARLELARRRGDGHRLHAGVDRPQGAVAAHPLRLRLVCRLRHGRVPRIFR